MNVLVYTFIVLLIAQIGVELVLLFLNAKHVAGHQGTVPESFRGFCTQEVFDKSLTYTLAKLQFDVLETLFGAMILAVVILGKWLPWMLDLFGNVWGSGIWGNALSFLAIGVVLSIPTLPLEYYNQFALEARFGFNKSTRRLWVLDKVKELLLSFVIGTPVLALLLWMVTLYPSTWWFWGFVALFSFQLLMLILYPRLILPIFNKLSPLKDGELKERLFQLADRTGFSAKTIEVIDGSKRSTHSNAYFTGFGRFRRIVLFDTLIEQMTHEQIEAVLAHEIGHYKKGHVPKMILMSGLFTLVGLFCVYWLSLQPAFYEAFGFAPAQGIICIFLLFSYLSGLVTFWTTPLFNAWSRKHEYEADAFAKLHIGSATPLTSALEKLSEKNLSNLVPHPLYSTFYYSHPTLLEREQRLL